RPATLHPGLRKTNPPDAAAQADLRRETVAGPALEPQPAWLLAAGIRRIVFPAAAQARALHLGRGPDSPASAGRHSGTKPDRLAPAHVSLTARARIDSQGLRVFRESLGRPRRLSGERLVERRLERGRG